MLIRRAKLDEGKILSKIAMRSKAYWGYDDSFMEACREDLTLTENIIASNLVYVLENSSFIIGFFCLIVSGKSGKLDAFC